MSELLNCDVVMKGGITSGVVYPPTIIELSKRFRFKNVGGTSAGAIAAALTAAAEYGRDKPAAGFDCFAQVPGRLATNLKGFFRPQPKTKALFRLFLAAMGRVAAPPDMGNRQPPSGPPLKPPRVALKVSLALIRGFPIASLIGAAPGLISFWFVINAGQAGILAALSAAASLLLLTVGAILAAAVHAFLHAKTALPDNFYGLCLGWSPRRKNQLPELTEWLSGLINELAGRNPDDSPLTFGDLWGHSDPAMERKINLAMITTNLTHGRPYRLPFEENIFYFHPEEMKKIFPLHVVKWLVEHPRETKDDPDKHSPLRPLPPASELPVIVATRMSLSFPGLISAVPLYAIDYGLPAEEHERAPERCWFSDGGITSNFPVHFFDSVLPRWPTFAINLRNHDPIYKDVPDVWMPESNLGGITRAWDRFDQQRGRRLSGFANAILLTMQNWMDNLQLAMPGYRDRVVHIKLYAGEGGMNLDMPKEVLDRLNDRGTRAGLELIERFAHAAHPMGWDNHRWIRFRSTLALVERTLEGLARGYNYQGTARRYSELIQRGLEEPPKAYRWASETQRLDGIDATQALVHLGGEWAKTPGRFDDVTAPDPSPVLRIMPRV